VEIKKAFQEIQQRIAKACKKTKRDINSITIIGVTKTQGTDAIIASAELGILNIGESYVQEALPKIEAVSPNALSKKITWHFIGRLQTNKIKMLDKKFSYVHSVYKSDQLKELDKRITSELGIFFEMNTGAEESKGGASNTDEITGLVNELLGINSKRKATGKPELRPMGLMCIPPFSDEPENSRKYFVALRTALERINAICGTTMKGLSMGMSSDFDIAIEEGATHVRIGTLLYGERERV
jgi:pyridoxal phosphate enzyme (YggS family)